MNIVDFNVLFLNTATGIVVDKLEKKMLFWL